MTVSSTLPITSVDKTLPADHSVISQSAPIAIFPELPQQARLLQAAFAQPRRQIGIAVTWLVLYEAIRRSLS